MGSVEVLPAEEAPGVASIFANSWEMGDLTKVTVRITGLAPQPERLRRVVQESSRHVHTPPGATVLAERLKLIP